MLPEAIAHAIPATISPTMMHNPMLIPESYEPSDANTVIVFIRTKAMKATISDNLFFIVHLLKAASGTVRR